MQFGSRQKRNLISGAILGLVPDVIIAIIAQALWELGKKAVKGPLTASVGLAVVVLYFLGLNEIALLFAGGLSVMIGTNFQRLRKQTVGGFLGPALAGVKSSRTLQKTK